MPGTVAGDGHPIDADLLGLDRPVQTARGTAIAVIRRRDDVEDKPVVAVGEARHAVEAIRELVAFQERLFDGEVIPYSSPYFRSR